MLHSFAWFRVADNSGAGLAKCIRVFKRGRKEHGSIGDLVAVVPKNIRPVGRKKTKLKAGTIFKALIIRQKFPRVHPTGQWRSYFDNAIILFGTGPSYVKAGVYTPLSKRIYGPVSHELRRRGFSKVAALSRRLT
jgi:large subunit ribosomal protein L14